MNATLKKQPAEVVTVERASLDQLAKLNQLIADKNPTTEQMQRAFRLVPDLFRADLSKVNRYDFCRLIGRELPFKVLSSEIELEVDYGKDFFLKLVELYDRKVIGNKSWLDKLTEDIKRWGNPRQRIGVITKYKFFAVGCCNTQRLRGFDLVPANLNEFLAFKPRLVQFLPLNYVAGQCGSGWLWYSTNAEGVLESLFDAFPDTRSYNEIFRYGKLEMPTLVRRIVSSDQTNENGPC